MDLESMVNFKGYTCFLKGEADVFGTKVKSFRATFKNEEDIADTDAIRRAIARKFAILNELSVEMIKAIVSEETKSTIRKFKPVDVAFDFSDGENGDCALDIYFDCGKVFGRFTAHVRISSDGKKIEMRGLS